MVCASEAGTDPWNEQSGFVSTQRSHVAHLQDLTISIDIAHSDSGMMAQHSISYIQSGSAGRTTGTIQLAGR